MSRLKAVQGRIDERVAKDPEARRAVAAEASRRLQALSTRWTTEPKTWIGNDIKPIAEARTKWSRDKEQAFQEACNAVGNPDASLDGL